MGEGGGGAEKSLYTQADNKNYMKRTILEAQVDSIEFQANIILHNAPFIDP